jgi:hypothetical protein
MSGTKAGSAKRVETQRKKYGDDFFSKNGAKGGASHHRGGFASKNIGSDGMTGPERARAVKAKQIAERNQHENNQTSTE